MSIKIDPKLKIQWRDPTSLVANPGNHRRHPERQREVLRAALGDEGWIDPVIVNRRSGRIVDGHARVEEAVAQGAAQVPVIVIDVDEQAERRIVARHDRIGALAEIDLEALGKTLTDLGDIDLGKLGWDESILPAGIPEDNKAVDEDKLAETDKECPKCGFKW